MNACTKLSDNFFSVSTSDDAYKLIEDFETRNTVKFSCYKASKGFGNTGKKPLTPLTQDSAEHRIPVIVYLSLIVWNSYIS